MNQELKSQRKQSNGRTEWHFDNQVELMIQLDDMREAGWGVGDWVGAGSGLDVK